MKKLNQIVVLLLTSVILASCGCFKECVEKKNCSNQIKNSKHIIDIDYSKDLYDNYNSTFSGKIKKIQDSILTREDYKTTKYVLVNLDTLRCYIKLLEEVEEKNGKKITGIAIFLGANNKEELYHKKPPFNKLHEKEINFEKNINNDGSAFNKDIRGRITMFMAPTFRLESLNESYSEVQRHVPFYIEPYKNNPDPYKGEYINLLSLYYPSSDNNESNAASLQMYKTSSSTVTNSNSGKTSLILEEFTDMPPDNPVTTKN